MIPATYTIDDEEKLVPTTENEVTTPYRTQPISEILLRMALSMDTLPGGLPHFHLVDYYPTTCPFQLTEEEWAARRLVWNFKNAPDIDEERHRKALWQVVSKIKSQLITTFGTHNLKHLTLVCIPASDNDKTARRYADFSALLCSQTGMADAFSRIYVNTSRKPMHDGGVRSSLAYITFDQEYFRGRSVLLFDDIVTKGHSMRLFKYQMEQMGATVVAGISVGKTKYQRDVKTEEGIPSERVQRRCPHL